MGVLAYLIPLALVLGTAGLLAFVWAIKTGQYDDLDGAAQRILIDDDQPLDAAKQQGNAQDVKKSRKKR